MAFDKIAIVGCGAVGLYYGGMLARAGRQVHFLLRSDYDAVAEKGIRLLLPDDDVRLAPVHAHRDTAEIGPVDLVIIALKATANPALTGLIPTLLKDDAALLTLQNGLGNETYLAEHFGAERVLGGLCFICLNRVGPGEVRNLLPGSLTLGEYALPAGRRVREATEMFAAAGIDCRTAENLTEARWRKLVWNIPFNGLTIAAGGIDTGKLLASEPLTSEIEALMREVRDTARALGIEIEDSFLETQICVTRGMGGYHPSSLIDFQEGRPVEVEAIWENPLREARKAGVPTPRLQLLHALLSTLGTGRSSRPAES